MKQVMSYKAEQKTYIQHWIAKLFYQLFKLNRSLHLWNQHFIYTDQTKGHRGVSFFIFHSCFLILGCCSCVQGHFGSIHLRSRLDETFWQLFFFFLLTCVHCFFHTSDFILTEMLNISCSGEILKRVVWTNTWVNDISIVILLTQRSTKFRKRQQFNSQTANFLHPQCLFMFPSHSVLKLQRMRLKLLFSSSSLDISFAHISLCLSPYLFMCLTRAGASALALLRHFIKVLLIAHSSPRLLTWPWNFVVCVCVCAARAYVHNHALGNCQ